MRDILLSYSYVAVHLENGQRVYFTEQTAVSSATSDPPKTTLTEFFALCEIDNFAQTLLYADMPQYYTWRNKSWSRRKQGSDVLDFPNVKKAHVIGRIYMINLRQGECFYLRLLLTHVRGPQSFNDLRTVNGDLCSSFHEACPYWKMTVITTQQCKKHLSVIHLLEFVHCLL